MKGQRIKVKGQRIKVKGCRLKTKSLAWEHKGLKMTADGEVQVKIISYIFSFPLSHACRSIVPPFRDDDGSDFRTHNFRPLSSDVCHLPSVLCPLRAAAQLEERRRVIRPLSSVLCHLYSVICFLTPETWHLTPFSVIFLQ